MSQQEPVIRIRGLRNQFGSQVVHENLDLDVFRGHPVYNNVRADISGLFPGLYNTTGGRGAVGHFTIDTRTLSNGLHTINWVIRDNTGQASGVGSRYFRVQN